MSYSAAFQSDSWLAANWRRHYRHVSRLSSRIGLRPGMPCDGPLRGAMMRGP